MLEVLVFLSTSEGPANIFEECLTPLSSKLLGKEEHGLSDKD